MVKASYRQINWEDVGDVKKAEFKMLFYSSIRLIRRLERKLVQMAEAYKAFGSTMDKSDKDN